MSTAGVAQKNAENIKTKTVKLKSMTFLDTNPGKKNPSNFMDYCFYNDNIHSQWFEKRSGCGS